MWGDVVTCGLVMLGKGRILGDWCSLIRGQGKGPGARFPKVPIINGPGKLSPFTLKIEVSIVLYLTRQNCQLMKQNAVVC